MLLSESSCAINSVFIDAVQFKVCINTLKSSFGKECCMLESEVSGYKQCIIYGDVHVFVLQFVPKDRLSVFCLDPQTCESTMGFKISGIVGSVIFFQMKSINS